MNDGRRPDPRPGEGPKTPVAAMSVGVVAIACCAGGPLLAAALSSVALGTALGAGAGVVALIAMTAAIVVRARRRART
jgi:hypothetical protein